MNRASMLWLIVAGVLFVAGSLFAGDTEVGGEVYARWNLALNDQSIASAEQVKNYNNFEIAQAWIDIHHTFNEKYWARLTTDLYSGDSNVDAFVQFAYLHINDVLPYTGLRFGLQEGVWADMVDKAWTLRYVDVASMEQFGYAEYADFGASLYSTCPGNWGSLVLQVTNGGGFNHSEANKYKDITLFAEVNPFKDNPDWSSSAIYGMYYYGFPNIAPMPGASFSDNTTKQRMAVAGKLTYKEWFTLYADFFTTADDDSIFQAEDTPYPEEDKSNGVTVFGRISASQDEGTFLSHVFLFGKFEFLDMHKDHTDATLALYAEEGDTKQLLVGAGYQMVEGLEVALTFKRVTTDRIEFDEDAEPLRIAETERNTVMVNFLASF